MKVEEQIKGEIGKILEDLGVGDQVVVFSKDLSHADLSTSISLTIFHKVKDKFANPLELGNHIADLLQKNVSNSVGKVEVLPPGFINIFFHENLLIENLEKINSSKEEYGKSKNLDKKKIILEFADPNPFKEFHIGHLRNIALGESYARLIESQGADVLRANYQGDVGMHVAKAIYGLLEMGNFTQLPEDEKIKALGKAYAAGAKVYEEDEEAKKKIQELNLRIYRKDDPKVTELWVEGRKASLDHFEEIYKRLDTQYDKYYFESQTAGPGREIVLENLEKGVFEKHEGAIVFRGGVHTRVFVTSEDYATYEAKDLALAQIKYKDFEYDQSIIITANEQEEYFKVVLSAMKAVSPKLAEKTNHYSFGFVNLKDGKMSSRKGDVVAGQWLLDEAKNKLKEKFKEMDAEMLEDVAVGAVKYSMLKFSRKSDISFSFDESIDLSGNSGPYIQYTYVRTQSVLAKKQLTVNNLQLTKDLNEEELLLLRLLIQFPQVVKDSQENFAPNTLTNYLFELSQIFNNFYQKHKIIGGENEEFRLNLTSGVGIVLSNGLYILGIKSPKKM